MTRKIESENTFSPRALARTTEIISGFALVSASGELIGGRFAEIVTAIYDAPWQIMNTIESTMGLATQMPTPPTAKEKVIQLVQLAAISAFAAGWFELQSRTNPTGPRRRKKPPNRKNL
jgi:hypothetical protein